MECDGANTRLADTSTINPKSRSRSRRRNVSDTGQTNASNTSIKENTPAAKILCLREQQPHRLSEPTDRSLLSSSFIPLPKSPEATSPPAPGRDNEFKGRVSSPERPTAGGVAFPFKLGRRLGDDGVNASTFTLEDEEGVLDRDGADGGLQGEVKRLEVERFVTAREA